MLHFVCFVCLCKRLLDVEDVSDFETEIASESKLRTNTLTVGVAV